MIGSWLRHILISASKKTSARFPQIDLCLPEDLGSIVWPVLRVLTRTVIYRFNSLTVFVIRSSSRSTDREKTYRSVAENTAYFTLLRA